MVYHERVGNYKLTCKVASLSLIDILLLLLRTVRNIDIFSSN